MTFQSYCRSNNCNIYIVSKLDIFRSDFYRPLFLNFESFNYYFKMWFIVSVYKEKKLLSEDAVEMESTETFGDLLFEVLGYDIFDQPVVVQFYNELTKNWAGIKSGLSASLSLCEKFQPCQMKFILKEQEDLIEREQENRQGINGLNKIMEASRTCKLPKERNCNKTGFTL